MIFRRMLDIHQQFTCNPMVSNLIQEVVHNFRLYIRWSRPCGPLYSTLVQVASLIIRDWLFYDIHVNKVYIFRNRTSFNTRLLYQTLKDAPSAYFLFPQVFAYNTNNMKYFILSCLNKSEESKQCSDPFVRLRVVWWLQLEFFF